MIGSTYLTLVFLLEEGALPLPYLCLIGEEGDKPLPYLVTAAHCGMCEVSHH
jgi:hypothetical protein